MKKKLLTAILACSGFTALAQVVNIPDPIFEQLLIDKEIDTDGIVNSQISTEDALAITSLAITYEDHNDLDFITDLTGIEAFVNLENLAIDFTMVEHLNLSTLINLKRLDCGSYNMLYSVDVSHNTLLEFLDVSRGYGDVGPITSITEIDLSHNPNISVLYASGLNFINLKNGNNNSNMIIKINSIAEGPWGPEPVGHTCIEVDDSEAAQNNALPYSEWDIEHNHTIYAFAADCSLNTKGFSKNDITIYPNPTSNILTFKTANDITVDEAIIFDISGRIVKRYNNTGSSISTLELQTGTYIIKLFSGTETFTQKVIKN